MLVELWLRDLQLPCRPLASPDTDSHEGSEGEHSNHAKEREGPCRHHARLLLVSHDLLSKETLFRIILSSYH